ncbi:MAG: hypothetical protein ACI4F7_04295, partial [Acutalibacteraceae bacterium]
MLIGETRTHELPEFIQLKKVEDGNPLWKVSLQGKRLGNVHTQYDAREDYLYNLSVGYVGENPIDATVKYTVFVRRHESSHVVGENSVKISLNPGETKNITIDYAQWVDSFCIYYTEVEIFTGEPAPEDSRIFSVSRIRKPDALNSRMGVSAHLFGGGRTPDQIAMLAQAGAGFVRTDFPWVEIEKEPDKLVIPDYWEE